MPCSPPDHDVKTKEKRILFFVAAPVESPIKAGTEKAKRHAPINHQQRSKEQKIRQ